MLPVRMKKNKSADFARDRVGMLLVSERIECSPQTMRMIKRDLIHTVKKYAGAEEALAVLDIESETAILHFRIPLRKKNTGM